MDFFSLKDERTFNDLLTLAGYGIKKTINAGYEVLSSRATLKQFSDDMGISLRTAQRYQSNNAAPRYIMKILLIMSGYMGEIHPDWKNWGIHRRDGSLFTSESPQVSFTPHALLSVWWTRSRMDDYNRIQRRAEVERKELKELKKEELYKYMAVFEAAASKAAAETMRALLDNDLTDKGTLSRLVEDTEKDNSLLNIEAIATYKKKAR